MKKLKFRIITTLIHWILLLVGKTSRLVIINEKGLKNIKKPVIWSFWHNRLLYLAYFARGTKVGVMVSTHKDGEYIASVMKKLDLVPIRGSSTRGGVKALLEIIDYMKNSRFNIAFTPDGPRGPKYTLHPGVLLAAQKTGAAIIPVSWYARFKKILKSWDNFILPFPFNQFVLAYGNPVYVKHNDNIKKMEKILKREMMAIVKITEEYFT
ncbi:MAG: lysophospholipid acyltransferase family protein [Spirochaetes bacterium]|nr:lysophospholipid acyltransferase family protein [Spirochaetota bacterium]